LDLNAGADGGAAAAAEVAAVAAAATSEELPADPSAAAASEIDDALVASVELNLPLDLEIELEEEPIAETLIPPSFDYVVGDAEDPLTAAFAALNLQMPQMPEQLPRAAAETLGADNQSTSSSAAAAAAAEGGAASSAGSVPKDSQDGSGLRLGQDGALMSAAAADVSVTSQNNKQQQKRQPATVLAAAAPPKQVPTQKQQQQQLQKETLDTAANTAAAATAAVVLATKGGKPPMYTPYTPLPPGVPIDANLLGSFAHSRRGEKPAEVKMTTAAAGAAAAAAVAAAAAPPPPPVLTPVPSKTSTVSAKPQAVYIPWGSDGAAAALADAPPCPFPLTKRNAVVDRQGRFFGWSNGAECMFKPAAAVASTKLSQPSAAWAAAKPCAKKLAGQLATADSAGLLWGWENGASCAFKTTGQQQQQQQQQGLVNSASVSTAISWEDAPVCMNAPTQGTVVWDEKERGWGQEHGQRCAFRVSGV
jgi:hypothetical protein